VTYKTGFGLDDWIYRHFINITRNYRQYSAVAILRAFQFTFPCALGFSVLTTRILATDLSQSSCNFKSRMKSSSHCLIPFLPFLLNHLRLPSPELDLIPFRLLSYIPCYSVSTTLHGPHGKRRLLLSRMRVYWSVSQHWTSYFFFREFASAEMCLPTRCLPVGIYVKILFYCAQCLSIKQLYFKEASTFWNQIFGWTFFKNWRRIQFVA
jgi:hypothetical protein